tara:strand:- start:1217 stop:1702 length:486 start_codon:yes stop_codon:yes gene_type:complete
MSGGGKGGGSTSKQEIPKWVEEPSKRNLRRAEVAQQIGYQPYIGPDLAAFSPAQEAARDNTYGAAAAYGLGTPTKSGLPEATDFGGGITGYSSFPMFDQAREEMRARDPNSAAIYDSLFGDQNPQADGNEFRGNAARGGGGSNFMDKAKKAGRFGVVGSLF